MRSKGSELMRSKGSELMRSIVMGVVALGATAMLTPSQSWADSDDSSAWTALDRAKTTTASIGRGAKLLIEGVSLEKGTALEASLIPWVVFMPNKTLDDYVRDGDQKLFNVRRLSVFGSAAALGDGEGMTDVLGTYRVGAKWAFFDSTSMFQKKKVDRLIGALGDEVGDSLETAAYKRASAKHAVNMKRKALDLIEQQFEARCLGGSGFDDWNTKVINPNVVAGGDLTTDANEKCVANDWGATRAIVYRLMRQAENHLDNIQPECGVQSQSLTYVEAFPILGGTNEPAAVKSFDAEFDATCDAAGADALKELKNKVDYDKLREELSSGWIVAVSAAFVNESTVDATGNVTRDKQGDVSLLGTYRWFGAKSSLDATITFVQAAINKGDDSFVSRHGVGITYEFLRGRINDSSLTLGFEFATDGALADGVERSTTLTESFTLPFAENVALVFSLSETKTGGVSEWDKRIGVTLSWSYENDGKKESRSIDFAKDYKPDE